MLPDLVVLMKIGKFVLSVVTSPYKDVGKQYKTMAKTKLVTLKLSRESLREFPTDFSSVKTEKITKETRKRAPPKKPQTISPTPEKAAASNDGNQNNKSSGNGNSAAISSNTAQSSSNSDDTKKLDKSGTASRKWRKKPLVIQSFTGYSITLKSWTGGGNGPGHKKRNSQSIHIKLNNKNLQLDSEEAGPPSP